MSRAILNLGDKVTIHAERLGELFVALQNGGNKNIGPMVGDAVVAFDRLKSPQ